MIWGTKCHKKNYPVVCGGYVKYEEAEVDISAIIQDFRDNEKTRLKKAASLPFWILFLQNSSWFILV